MPMNSPGSVSKISTPSIAATAATKSGREPSANAPRAAPRVDAVEPHERRDVDELDQRGDDDGRQRRLGQRLEQAGEEQQRDHGQHGDDQPGELGLRAGGGVDGRLGEAAVDDHAARQPRREVRAAEAEQLAVGVDLVVVAGGVGLGRAEALGEADQHHPDRAGGEVAVVAEAGVGQAERRQPGVDVADDVEPVVVEVEQLRPARCRAAPRPASPARPARSAAARARAPASRRRRPASARRSSRGCRAGPRASRRSRRRRCRRRTASAPGRR